MSSKKPRALYDHACDYCEGGWVRCETRPREFIRVGKLDFVALEKVPVGICDKCKARYYDASVLKQAHTLRRKGAERAVKIPVAPYVPAT